jgi:hypothetical protein
VAIITCSRSFGKMKVYRSLDRQSFEVRKLAIGVSFVLDVKRCFLEKLILYFARASVTGTGGLNELFLLMVATIFDFGGRFQSSTKPISVQFKELLLTTS